ncbi:DUF6252 family protein [Flavobacteriaceae bacterium TK19130]|nr:DUF6252 family protein [Thermobacterium salinum]
MKTLQKALLVLFMAAAVVACKKDDDGGDDPSGGTGSFTAKVDGNTFTGIEGTVVAQVTSNGGGEVLAISGGTNASENLQMIVQGFDGEGSYNLNFTSIGTYSYLPDPSNPDPNTVVVYTTVGDAQSNNGEVNVSSYDGTTIKGTFSFTGFNLDDNADTVSVTEGEFNIEVTNN